MRDYAPKANLITEEPDLEALFNNAVEEISNQVEDDDFDADYVKLPILVG